MYPDQNETFGNIFKLNLKRLTLLHTQKTNNKKSIILDFTVHLLDFYTFLYNWIHCWCSFILVSIYFPGLLTHSPPPTFKFYYLFIYLFIFFLSLVYEKKPGKWRHSRFFIFIFYFFWFLNMYAAKMWDDAAADFCGWFTPDFIGLF